MPDKVLRGVDHGNVIELVDEAGIPDGEQVEVTVRCLGPQEMQPGLGFLRTEGALADDSEWDRIMEEVQFFR
jgi:hypothetical protein